MNPVLKPLMQRHCRSAQITLCALALLATNAQAAGPTLAGCPMLPETHILNTPVEQLPVDPASAAYIASIGATRTLRADFGSGLWEGGPIGIPYTRVTNAQAKSSISFTYADESDAGPYPIPANPDIEGGSQSSGDRHVLLLQEDECRLYELYAAYPGGTGWRAGSGAIFDLRSHALRPFGWTSADAAGLPILPLLARYDEVAAGEIRHALRFTLPTIRREAVWPARHVVNNQTSATYPPMGQRFRLKADYDLSSFSPETRVILSAAKKYGLILADIGSALYISGVPDARWNNTTLRELQRVPASALEAVDVASLKVGNDSGEARGATPDYAFAAVIGGTAQAMSVAVDFTIAPADTGQEGHLYLAATAGNALYLYDGQAWRRHEGGMLPALLSGALRSQRVPVVAAIDSRTLAGIRLYAGYGRSADEMLQAGRYRLIHSFGP